MKYFEKRIKEPIFQIFLFLILAFILPFACVLTVKNTILGQIEILNFIVFGVQAASPTIAAILSFLILREKQSIKEFFRFCFSPKLNRYSWFICLIIAFTIMFSAKIISSLMLKKQFEIAELSSKQLIIIGWAFIAEEIGWRGYLTKELTVLTNRRLTPFIVGLIWAFWHYHFYMSGTIDVPIALFVAGCIVDSYLYSALLNISKGNILIAMLYHMASNFFINLFMINPNVNGRSVIPYAAYVSISAIFVIIIFNALKHRAHAN